MFRLAYTIALIYLFLSLTLVITEFIVYSVISIFLSARVLILSLFSAHIKKIIFSLNYTISSLISSLLTNFWRVEHSFMPSYYTFGFLDWLIKSIVKFIRFCATSVSMSSSIFSSSVRMSRNLNIIVPQNH